MTLLLFLQTKIRERTYLQFSIFFDIFSCFKKRLKVNLYSQSVLSEDEVANDFGDIERFLRFLLHCGSLPLDYSLWYL